MSAASKKKDKQRERRQKAKENKKELRAAAKEVHSWAQQQREAEAAAGKKSKDITQNASDDTQVVVEYVPAPLEVFEEVKSATEAAAISHDAYSVDGVSVKAENESQDTVQELERLARHFGALTSPDDDVNSEEDGDGGTAAKPDADEEAEEDEDEEDGDEEAHQSNKARKAEMRMKIASLKQECPRPEVVEVWDVTAQDPKLLVFLKSYRNTVPVPRHWSQKRKFLQGKRGIEKPPFELPSFIQATGISDMRNAMEERVEEKLKNKGRQRMRPKMGKMEIDYEALHNAFFKYQTKPKTSGIGDLYYEGKEFEMKPTNAFPGVLSQELRAALGMGETDPPPWLINMQRYGPPPSYPDLKVPGLNAPIPPGAEFGYQPGGWGKPPVDQDGQPIYGDVFGQADEADDDLAIEEKTRRWGEMEDDEETSSEEEESEEEGGGAELSQEALEQGIASGMMTGLASSLPSGIDTDATLELRKGGTTTSGTTPALYTVLQQQQAAAAQQGLMAVGHTYAMPGGDKDERPANAAARKRLEMVQGKNAGPASIDVAVDPEELEALGPQALERLYANQAAGPAEDYTDMIAAHSAAKKRKLQEQAASKAAKKAKDSFKF